MRPTAYSTHCDKPIHARHVKVRALPQTREEAERIEACAGRPVFLRD